MLACMHKYINTYMHTQIRTLIKSGKIESRLEDVTRMIHENTYIHTSTRYVYINTYTHMLACMHKYINKYTHTQIKTLIKSGKIETRVEDVTRLIRGKAFSPVNLSLKRNGENIDISVSHNISPEKGVQPG